MRHALYANVDGNCIMTMNPLKELTDGLKILEPFLTENGFGLDRFDNGKGSGGQFTIATYKNRDKAFVIGYRYSIGELHYQYKDKAVGHEFYLKQLGHGHKMKFPDFQSDDRLETFRNVLHDFQLIKVDFFEGQCKDLLRIETLQADWIRKLKKESPTKGRNYADTLKIEKAREKFKRKDYAESFKIYQTVEHPDTLSDFDIRTINYLKQKSRWYTATNKMYNPWRTSSDKKDLVFSSSDVKAMISNK